MVQKDVVPSNTQNQLVGLHAIGGIWRVVRIRVFRLHTAAPSLQCYKNPLSWI